MDGGRQAGPDDGAGGRGDGMDGTAGAGDTAGTAGTASTSFAVIGAGGIGGWLGTRLAEAGHHVGFLVHGATLEALRRRGLTLIGPEGSVSARIEAPVAAADPAELLAALGSRPRAVLLTTKVGAITGLAPALRALTGPRTAVVTTQNGLEAPRLVARAVGRERVLPGVARVYARVVGRGRVETMSGPGAMHLGEWGGGASPRVHALVAALRSAGVSARASEDIWAELWRKAAFVVPQGGLGAVAQAPIGVLRTALRDSYRAMVREAVEVAAALGHPVAEDPAAYTERVLALADQQPEHATTSMQRDIDAGLPSELDAQVGAVCRAGDEAGVPTPVHDLVLAALVLRERASQERRRTICEPVDQQVLRTNP